jgi:hypothetical protein
MFQHNHGSRKRAGRRNQSSDFERRLCLQLPYFTIHSSLIRIYSVSGNTTVTNKCIQSTHPHSFYLFQCKDYLRLVLLWIEQQDSVVVYLIFVVLFTLVSFPFTWGYIFLNLACGYLFGTLQGLVVVAVAAAIGITFAHYVIQTYFAELATQRLFHNATAKALLAVISGPHAFKVILFARLTPIPFGLQNTIFAVRLFINNHQTINWIFIYFF